MVLAELSIFMGGGFQSVCGVCMRLRQIFEQLYTCVALSQNGIPGEA